MDPAARIRERMEEVMRQMARPVLLHDLREHAQPRRLQGYRTKGKGKDAPTVFRFLDKVEGLRVDAVLQAEGEPERWRVMALEQEEEGGQALFFTASVLSLDAGAAAKAAPSGLKGLLASLEELLERSTLEPLEREDLREALKRLAALAAGPASPGLRARVKVRLALVKDGLKRCPQASGPAQPLLLKLEAQLKRLDLL